MSRKSMVITGAVALVLVAAVVALALSSKDNSSSTNQNASNSASTTQTASTPGTGTASASRTATRTTSATSSVDETAAATGPNKPFPALPDPGIPARAPGSSTAPKGATLAPLTEAPKSTISGLKLGTVPEGSRYRITLRPYGIGPSMLWGSRLAIRIDSSIPMGAPKLSVIVNANVLAVADTTADGTITKGGTYMATLQFLSDGNKLIPVLSAVKSVK